MGRGWWRPCYLPWLVTFGYGLGILYVPWIILALFAALPFCDAVDVAIAVPTAIFPILGWDALTKGDGYFLLIIVVFIYLEFFTWRFVIKRKGVLIMSDKKEVMKLANGETLKRDGMNISLQGTGWVCVWRFTKKGLKKREPGHVSLLLPGGRYISFWPVVTPPTKTSSILSEFVNSLAKDIKSERGETPEMIQLTPELGLDESRIIKKHDKELLNPVQFQFKCQNCAKTVLEYLEEGGMTFPPVSFTRKILLAFRRNRKNETYFKNPVKYNPNLTADRVTEAVLYSKLGCLGRGLYWSLTKFTNLLEVAGYAFIFVYFCLLNAVRVGQIRKEDLNVVGFVGQIMENFLSCMNFLVDFVLVRC